MIKLKSADAEPGASDCHGDHRRPRFPFFGPRHHGSGRESDGRGTIQGISNGSDRLRKGWRVMKTCGKENCRRRSLELLSKCSGEA